MGKQVLPEAENYWSSYLCSQSSITAQVMTRKLFKKLTETIHINNNDRDPMLVNGMNKWQFSLIVYFNHYVFSMKLYEALCLEAKNYYQKKSNRKDISCPPDLHEICAKTCKRY